mmetsp:Transcript_13681/g.24400  ORF Transcript_13681/g.24400 Transcript_13681/m.24400 type:complete len:227 (+) Transcript_13681:1557-2237(+)
MVCEVCFRAITKFLSRTFIAISCSLSPGIKLTTKMTLANDPVPRVTTRLKSSLDAFNTLVAEASTPSSPRSVSKVSSSCSASLVSALSGSRLLLSSVSLCSWRLPMPWVTQFSFLKGMAPLKVSEAGNALLFSTLMPGVLLIDIFSKTDDTLPLVHLVCCLSVKRSVFVYNWLAGYEVQFNDVRTVASGSLFLSFFLSFFLPLSLSFSVLVCVRLARFYGLIPGSP